MRVLVVEDEEYLAEAIATGLRREAMAVDVVGDGASALEQVAVNDYDIIVLDRDLPVVHGDEVCRRVVRDHLDPCRREVYRDVHFIHLSPKEFAVLQVLMEAEGGVLSAETLLEKAWDANADPFTNSTRVTISHLRRKLGEPRVIQTVPGAGYRFSA